MRNDIEEYVRGCDICQRVKAHRQQKAGELQSLPLPTKPFESISMDFITDLPPSTDSLTDAVYDSIMVIVDRYTKTTRLIPCRKTIDAPDLARLFISMWFKDQGLPSSIISDRGSVFTSRFWKELCFLIQITRGLSTAFHPQTDGQTERLNQIIEAWLRSFVCYQQDDWVELLPIAEFAYNNAPHDSIGMSPNQARYGISLDTRQGIEDDPQRGEIPTVKQFAEHIIEKRAELEKAWLKAKESQAKWYNKNHRPIEFKVKDLVLLSSKNIRTVRASKKLDHRFLGPFKIEKRIGKQAYRLALPSKYSRIHNVFHVSLLEPYYQRTGETPHVIQPDLIDGQESWEVLDILDKRTRKGTDEYLIRWKGFGPADDSWEPISNLDQCLELVQEFHQRRSKRNKTSPGIHR